MAVAGALRAKALRVHQLLLEHYGPPALKEQRAPLDELVLTILSQNTADTNSGRAWVSLRERFPSWHQVLSADVADIEDAIRVGGLAHIKATRIQRILKTLEARGDLDLSFLADLPLEEARSYLSALPGVGPKTTACVLLFSLHKPALPVDTHVHRVARRVGLVPPRSSAEKAHVLLEELLPEETYYPFHLNVIRHGRQVCKASKPRCDACPLGVECDHFAKQELIVVTKG